MEQDDLLREQIAYYRARATEYDEWFVRQGRYDRGPEHREAWLGEVAVVEAALEQALPSGGVVLELACGTGWWTSRLAARHQRVMAVDASPEVIAINRDRVKSDHVDYVVADLFEWVPPAGAFDAASSCDRRATDLDSPGSCRRHPPRRHRWPPRVLGLRL